LPAPTVASGSYFGKFVICSDASIGVRLYVGPLPAPTVASGSYFGALFRI